MDNCWVIAAISMIAIDAPEFIKAMFAREAPDEQDGHYDIKLYCNDQATWLKLDDFFPCDKHTVVFSSTG